MSIEIGKKWVNNFTSFFTFSGSIKECLSDKLSTCHSGVNQKTVDDDCCWGWILCGGVNLRGEIRLTRDIYQVGETSEKSGRQYWADKKDRYRIYKKKEEKNS